MGGRQCPHSCPACSSNTLHARCQWRQLREREAYSQGHLQTVKPGVKNAQCANKKERKHKITAQTQSSLNARHDERWWSVSCSRKCWYAPAASSPGGWGSTVHCVYTRVQKTFFDKRYYIYNLWIKAKGCWSPFVFHCKHNTIPSMWVEGKTWPHSSRTNTPVNEFGCSLFQLCWQLFAIVWKKKNRNASLNFLIEEVWQRWMLNLSCGVACPWFEIYSY